MAGFEQILVGCFDVAFFEGESAEGVVRAVDGVAVAPIAFSFGDCVEQFFGEAIGLVVVAGVERGFGEFVEAVEPTVAVGID